MKTFNGSEEYKAKYLSDLKCFLAENKEEKKEYLLPEGFPSWFELLLIQLHGKIPITETFWIPNNFNIGLLSITPVGADLSNTISQLAIKRLVEDIKVLKTMEPTTLVVQSSAALNLALDYLRSRFKIEQEYETADKYLNRLLKKVTCPNAEKDLMWVLDSAKWAINADKVFSVSRSARFKALIKHRKTPQEDLESLYRDEIRQERINLIELVYHAPIWEDDFESPEIKEAGNLLVKVCHEASTLSGWWNGVKTGESLRNNPHLIGTKLMLIVSEISEAMEGHRKNLMDDKLPHRKMIEVELADAVIRICDLAGALNLDLGGAITEKLIFNSTREDHKPEHRQSEHGKKY